jgi:uncharacterized protein YndB with AHSA1/START domain
MATDKIRCSTVIKASPKQIYDAWLDGKQHAAMTGGNRATGSARVGSRFTAWDSYIEGRNLELEPGKQIVQEWRASDFPKNAPSSRLEVKLARATGGTRVTLVHSEIPRGMGAGYLDGWKNFYFLPMKEHFAAQPKARPVTKSKPTVKKRPAAKSATAARAALRKRAVRGDGC